MDVKIACIVVLLLMQISVIKMQTNVTPIDEEVDDAMWALGVLILIQV